MDEDECVILSKKKPNFSLKPKTKKSNPQLK